MKHLAATRLVVALFLVCTLVGCSYRPTSKPELERTFDAEFGCPPDPTVSDYLCLVVPVGDSTATWFSFRCNGEIFEKLHVAGYLSGRSSDWINPVPMWQGDVVSKDPNAPDWWPGIPTSDLIFWKEWHTADGVGHFIYFWHSSEDGRVYVKSAEWQ